MELHNMPSKNEMACQCVTWPRMPSHQLHCNTKLLIRMMSQTRWEHTAVISVPAWQFEIPVCKNSEGCEAGDSGHTSLRFVCFEAAGPDAQRLETCTTANRHDST